MSRLEERLRCEYEFYDVRLVQIGEDIGPRSIVTRGHIEPVRFIAACNALARKEHGWKNLADGLEDADYEETLLGVMAGMRYTYARVLFATDPDAEDEICDWDCFDWYLILSEPGEKGAEQITVWSEYPHLWET